MITADRVTKRYGDTTALSDVSLSVERGSVLGLVGPNGAGKTTLLSILAGLRVPSEGTVTIDAPTSQISVLSDAPRFEPWLTGREIVELSLALTRPGSDTELVDHALSSAGIADAAERRVGGYSRGMLQRLGIAATVVAEPTVMILDEPASALDPMGRREVLDLVRSVRGDATVIFSSHILGDVQEVSDALGILDRGRLLYQGPASDLLVDRARPSYIIRLRDQRGAVVAALESAPWVESVELIGDRSLRIETTSLDIAEHELIPLLSTTGARVIGLEPDSPSLERIFLEVTQ
jgi:ABC-2 type transport system ATP-binding protein